MAQIDPRETEAVNVARGGRPIGLDLIALESTRFGLELLGLGLLVYLFGMGLAASAEPSGGVAGSRLFVLLVDALAFAGCVLLALAARAMAPTPNGPFPAALRAGLVLLFAAAALVCLINDFGPALGDPRWRRFQEGLWLAAHLAPLGIAWILWRFCQHRGLIGRALVWLWIALLWTLHAALVELADQHWARHFYLALGVLAFFAAHLTARDLWMDAVNRKTKKVVAARRLSGPGPAADDTPPPDARLGEA